MANWIHRDEEFKKIMKLETLFKKELKVAVKQGINHTRIDNVAGCIERKIVLTAAEAVAGKKVFDKFMAGKLWTDDEFGIGWLFGSPNTMLNIGLIPSYLASQRRGLNRHCWHLYGIVT